jgi:hypothetical protein
VARKLADEGRRAEDECSSSTLVGRRSSVVVEPTGDRITAEADHAAAIAIHLGDQRIVDLVELTSQLLGAAPLAKRAHQRLGEWRKAGDIGEQHRTACAAGQRRAAG